MKKSVCSLKGLERNLRFPVPHKDATPILTTSEKAEQTEKPTTPPGCMRKEDTGKTAAPTLERQRARQRRSQFTREQRPTRRNASGTGSRKPEL